MGPPGRPLRIAALISGGGRTLLNLADRIEDGSLRARIVLVIASRAEAPGVQRARQRGLNVRIASTKELGGETARDDVIERWLRETNPDLVCLCGYLSRLRVPAGFEGRVMNIHPALLPAFGGRGMHGLAVHRAVLAAGCRESGCTVHVVNEEYDQGPIILQRTVPVLPNDDPETLAARVFAQECIAYPEAIRLLAEGRLHIRGGSVQIDTPALASTETRGRVKESPGQGRRNPGG
jgi:formyltetrahydrofolate-dependent phosphoribosylglycinamide formyltransferase